MSGKISSASWRAKYVAKKFGDKKSKYTCCFFTLNISPKTLQVAVIVMYSDNTHTRKVSISILKYITLYTRPALHCSIERDVFAGGMGYLQKGGEHFFSLVMYGFYSSKAIYSASLSLTMFIGPVAAVWRVVKIGSVHPSLILVGFLELNR